MAAAIKKKKTSSVYSAKIFKICTDIIRDVESILSGNSDKSIILRLKSVGVWAKDDTPISILTKTINLLSKIDQDEVDKFDIDHDIDSISNDTLNRIVEFCTQTLVDRKNIKK